MDEQRKELFQFYQEFDSPILNITLQLELENFLPFLKLQKVSFFQYMVYNICKTNLEIDNFKYRFNGSDIYKIKKLVPSYTVLRESGNFNFCTFDFHDNFNIFLKSSLESKKKAEESLVLLKDDLSHRDYVFITCLPWFNFTSIQHPVGRFKDSSIPSFAIGKYSVHDSKLTIPLSIQAHHGLVDGIHISEFLKKLKSNLLKSHRVIA